MTACTLARAGICRKLLFGCKTLKCKTGWYQSLLHESMCWAELAHWSQLHSRSWWASSHRKRPKGDRSTFQHRGYRSDALPCYRLCFRQCRPRHNLHHPLSESYKYIYFCCWCLDYPLILAAKQTNGPNLRVSVMLACSSPTLETRVRVMGLERLTKTNL